VFGRQLPGEKPSPVVTNQMEFARARLVCECKHIRGEVDNVIAVDFQRASARRVAPLVKGERT
jgi:hypothetical protein